MRTELRPEIAGFDKSQSERGDFLGFKMSPQLEPVGEQRLHHQAHLVLRGIAIRLRVNHVFVIRPFWKSGAQIRLKRIELVGEPNVTGEWPTSQEMAARRLRIPLVQKRVGIVNVPGLASLMEATSKAILPPAAVCQSGTSGD